jgi:ketosteroid isomerase-like protein
MRENDIAELTQLNWDLQVATFEGDVAWMKKHLSPDFILIDTRGNIIDFEAWLKDIATQALEPFPPTEVVVRVDGNTGIVWARLLMKFARGGERVETDLRYTDVWIKGEDGWKYVAAHASPVSVTRVPLG